MSSSFPNLIFPKKIRQLGTVVLAAVLGVFCLAFTSSNKGHNSTFTLFDCSDNEASLNAIAGPNDTVDLALVLTTSSTFACPGTQVAFTIEILNQGLTTVERFELTNYVPTGLTLSATGNTGWVQTGNKVKKTVTGLLNPNGFTTQSISFDFDSDFIGASLENRVEISAADYDADPNNVALSEYTYNWSDGGIGHDRDFLTSGNYTITVTGCIDTLDIVIGTTCILNDTIPFTLETDSTETFCGNPIPNYFSNNTTTTLCAGGTLGGDGTYGTYSVSETGCLIYTSNSLPGSSIDTICVVVNDDMGNSDTTVFIPSIICHTIPQIMDVACDVATSTGDLCLDIPFDDIGNFNVTVDGVPVSTGFTGCQEDSTIVYDYAGLFAQGNFGPYELDSWVVAGQDLVITFQNVQELLDEMNDWDAEANWVLNTTDLTISGGDLDQEYEDLVITHPLTNATISIPPMVVYDFAGSSLEISEGLHTITYTEVGNNCPTASIQVTVSCASCVPFLPADTVGVVAANCLGTGDFCVNVSTANIFEYQILVDGMAYGGSLMACDFAAANDGTNLQLNVGLHEIIFTKISTACSDTVLVEVTCPPCDEWLTDMVTLETTTCGSTVETCINVPAATLSDYEIRDNGSLYTGSIGTCMNGTDATIAVDTGFHQITMLNLLSGCIDTMSLTINCVPGTFILNTLIEITMMDTLCLDEILVGDLALVEIICGDTINGTVNYMIDIVTNCIIFEGINFGIDTLCLRLTNNLGDRTDIMLNITVTPPCGDGFINMDSATLGLSDCAGTTPLCLEIPLGQIARYNIMDNGMAYTNGYAGCDFDTSYSYNYFALPAQGAAGPYNVDLWMVNDSTYSGMFMTVSDLVDSMNVWDTLGTWTL
ncbi:MAG: putative repeat protein (TIGR01451 family), partial [Granulosicoccus sp.]